VKTGRPVTGIRSMLLLEGQKSINLGKILITGKNSPLTNYELAG
jgi:hypothetical protein